MRSSRFQVPGSKAHPGCKFHAPARRPRFGIWNLRFGILTWLVFLAKPASVLACAACYGASDAPMARGMNWGIFSLLGVVTMVLGGIATFFVFIGKKSAAASNVPETDSEKKTQPSEKA
jgi:hypothetical protein